MQRTWMFISIAGLLVTLLTACQGDMSFPKGWTWGANNSPVSSEPVAENETTTQPADEAGNPPLETVEKNDSNQPTSLNNRIANYVNKFPPDDQGRKQQNNQQTKTPTGNSQNQQQGNHTSNPPAIAVNDSPTQQTQTSVQTGQEKPSQARTNSPASRGTNQPNLSIQKQQPSSNSNTAQASTIQANKPDRLKIELVNVRPAAASEQPDQIKDQPVASANRPARKNQPSSTSSLSQLLQQLKQSVRKHPQNIDEQFKLRLLYILTGNEEKATGPIEGAGPVRKELLTTLFEVVRTTREACTQPQTESAEALTALEELRRLIGQQASVMIPKIALVTRVNSFGNYDQVDPLEFPAGQSIHVFCYTEVDNFRYEPTNDGKLRSLMSEEIQIFNSRGKIIWEKKAAKIEETMHTPRRDFFIPFEIYIPAGPPPGEYILKVTIKDKIGMTTDQQRLTFTVTEN